jgi:hypothetical protein
VTWRATSSLYAKSPANVQKSGLIVPAVSRSAFDGVSVALADARPFMEI